MKLVAPLILLAGLAGAAAAQGASAEIRAEPEYQPYPAERPAPKERRVQAGLVRHVELAPASQIVVEKAASAPRLGIPQLVGVGRNVDDLADGVANVARLKWTALDSGARVAAFSVTSPGAASLRVALRARAIPAGTLIRFYGPDGGTVYEITAEQLQENVGRNLAAGLVSENALLYWSPVIEGETEVVEVELPAGASPAQLDLAAPQLSHLVTSPGRSFASPIAKATQAAACELDAACYLGTWNTESNATAKMLFTDQGATWLCTGTLLSDLDTTTTIPYFLSANHCIDNQAAASSLETFWFYRAAACNSSVTLPSFQDLTGGATLVYNSSVTDTSLMTLSSPPPGGAMYAGWSVGATLGVNASVATVHHPWGDKQKISFGRVNSFVSCTPQGSESFVCSSALPASSTFVEVNYDSGITEPGSSGAALFLASGHYVVGQLYGGSTTCNAPVNSDYFGRFDVAYQAGLSRFLAPSTSGGGAKPSQNYTALWWNPSESGWGMSLTQHNSTLFAAWYVYDANGQPTWVVMPGGTWTTGASITGALYSTSGPPSTAPFDASKVVATRVGTATIAFSAVDRGVLSYTVNGVSGTKPIQQQNFGVVDNTVVGNYADLWWTATESGWGLSVNQQYRTLFSVIYTYGASGQPLWYVMPGGSWNAGTYSGALYAASTPPFDYFSGAFNAGAVSARAVGTMSLQFSDTNTATLTYTVDGQTFTKAITREPF